MIIFLEYGGPYLDLAIKDNNGNDALAFLLLRAALYWKSGSTGTADVPAKIATLLRYGASANPQGSSRLHFIEKLGIVEVYSMEIHEEILECLCLLIKSGADIYAVQDTMTVTEGAHEFRKGRLWEDALESCGFNVDEVYAKDHSRGSEAADDIYAPRKDRPRIRGPMDIEAYLDLDSNGIKTPESTTSEHEGEEDSGYYSDIDSFHLGKGRILTEIEDDSDGEMGGVPIG